MHEDWVVVYKTSSLSTAYLVNNLLSENEIKGVIFNQQDSAYPVIGQIKVLVMQDDVLLARHIISKNGFEQ